MATHNSKTILILSATTIFLFISNFVFSQTEWLKVGTVANKYKKTIDSFNQHDGKNAITLKSIDSEIDGFGALMQNIKPDKYFGKRVRMTGYLKSKDVTDWSGFWFRVDQAGSQKSLSFDNMQDRPVKGTTDWLKYEIVLDVPNEASNIAFGALLSQTGQIWIDDVKFEVVDNSVQTTGQQTQY